LRLRYVWRSLKLKVLGLGLLFAILKRPSVTQLDLP